MNWGWNIVFAFIGFVGFIVYLAVRSFQTNVDLVTEDYYLQELQYQQRIEKTSNAQRLPGKLNISQQGEQLIIQFPEVITEKINGTVSLFRPSDARFDRNEEIAMNAQGQHQLRVNQLPKGYYKLKIEWKTPTEDYYTEEPVYLH
ncbi:MAG: FixH family protein [Cyclobacteriaceae bacterium]